MEAITAQTYPKHWEIYENLINKVNTFIEENPELVREVLEQQNAASLEPKPMQLLPLYFEDMPAFGTYNGAEIKINEKFKDVPLSVFESTLGHEISHAFFGDSSSLDRNSFFDLYNVIQRAECNANHFSLFFSDDDGQGLTAKYDGTIDEAMDRSMLMKAAGAIYKSTVSVHPSKDKIIEMAQDENLQNFAPGTVLFDGDCNYNPEEITHQTLQPNAESTSFVTL